jgi:MFS family permease
MPETALSRGGGTASDAAPATGTGASVSRRSVALTALALGAILVVGAALRFTGVNWDRGSHLHPDERYLSIVADNTDWPSSVAGYFDVEQSPLSPYNTEPGRSYVYGFLPLLATKGVATLTGRDSYGELNLVGRRLSALLDTLSIVLVFLIGRLLLGSFGRRAAMAGALIAAALYSLSALAIQHAHFFTVESWLVATTLLAFYLAALVATRPLDAPTHRTYALLAGLGAALALVAASKVSGLLVLIPVAIAIAARPGSGFSARDRALSFITSALSVTVVAYLVFRLVSPYAFEHSSWIHVEPNANYRAALEEQSRALSGDFLYPPAYQWLLSEPLVDPVRHLLVWGLGLPLGIAAVAGAAWLALQTAGMLLGRSRSAPLSRQASIVALMLLVFVAVSIAYFGSLFAHTIRYLLSVVPFLCVAAAVALVAFQRRSSRIGVALAVAVLVGTSIHAAAFVQVYRHPHTRIAATDWIMANVPPGSTVVNEHWDDGLPLGSPPGRYELRELPVFDPDDPTKLRKLFKGLAGADYYILSSPRASATIGQLPDRFPIMSPFYRRLDEGLLGFRAVARFTSYPRLLGVTVSDQDAEEAFWVYDHPPVVVYRRAEPLPWSRFRALLCSGDAAQACRSR